MNNASPDPSWDYYRTLAKMNFYEHRSDDFDKELELTVEKITKHLSITPKNGTTK
jgi:hypothetical protein